MQDPERKPRQRGARRAGGQPTVADVARLAGVSPMTVSRVVNSESYVTEDTRTRVQQAIEKLGYVPNLAARSLAGGQQCKVALLYDNPSSAYLSEFLVGSLAAASSENAQLVIEQCDPAEAASTLVKRLKRHRIDCVVLPPPLCDDSDLLDQLRKTGWPICQVATGQPAADAMSVSIDDEAAAYAITEHLIGMGHRKIGFITGDTRQSVSSQRLTGYERALRDAGLSVNPGYIAPGDFSYRSGLAAAEALLGQPDRPTAILASNDDMAAAAISVAHRHGLDVPSALSICGYDDTALATTIWPELTTIRQPVAEMAEAGTRMAISATRDPARTETPPQRVVLDFQLVCRNSASAPGKQA